jgi:hypothetical protein
MTHRPQERPAPPAPGPAEPRARAVGAILLPAAADV